ncbi:hypothetical protein CHU92_06560 [Flavobacterium cyanobacteriorum]|uniref:Outer membrane protein beta-barrel domain-containing protein n=1 Tax=Flavobacterium cyanobacteriorum TaxID=2022802 RepID=A0A255ZB86_9FLAO|nr:hypothetical protein [Flavobacterium cyanobacteriorum]OYQ38125.1 hypothetical protein CHU92_06560 [Flavobacterium cyanobacteriorum]
MKKLQLKKVLLWAVLITGFAGSAQDITGSPSRELNNFPQVFRLGFGLNLGLPVDDEFDAYTFAVGGDVRLQYDFTSKASITLTTGYQHFFGDNYEVAGQEFDAEDLGFIPVKAGFKYFVWEDRFYLLGEAGAGFAVTTDETSFLWSPGIGYANNFIDISLRYEGSNDFNTDQVALRFAYGFKL